MSVSYRMRNESTALRPLLRRVWVRGLGFAIGCGIGVLAAAPFSLPSGAAPQPTVPVSPAPVRPAHDPVQALVDAHDCWQGPAPAGRPRPLPGHAVVARGGDAPAYVGAELTGRALEHVFDDSYPGLSVYAFCP